MLPAPGASADCNAAVNELVARREPRLRQGLGCDSSSGEVDGSVRIVVAAVPIAHCPAWYQSLVARSSILGAIGLGKIRGVTRRSDRRNRRRRSRAVISLAVSSRRHSDRPRRDVRRQAGLLRGRVIAAACAGNGHAGDGHRQSCADILIRKRARRRAPGETESIE